MPNGPVLDAQAQGQAAAPHVVEAEPVLPEAVPAADEPQASTLAMHTLGDGEVAGQHALPVYLVTLYSSCMFHLVSCVCFCGPPCCYKL